MAFKERHLIEENLSKEDLDKIINGSKNGPVDLEKMTNHHSSEAEHLMELLPAAAGATALGAVGLGLYNHYKRKKR